jgi:NAD(P)-dependent dehydrogenase (short-subunit alcohol dehydrogenase family)
MTAAVRAIEAEHGHVHALVNNAGYSQSGAIEAVAIDRVRTQFETNVFGPVRLTQLVLPGMRRARAGRIVNISSMGGRLVFAGGGVYHATKYAIEAISDALRFEVRGFGIAVVIIQPGLVKTRFGETAVSGIETVDQSVYAPFHARVAEATTNAYGRGITSRLAGSPDDVAKVIETAISAARPKTRYTVTASATVFMNQRRWLGDRAWDRFLRSIYPSPGAKKD